MSRRHVTPSGGGGGGQVNANLIFDAPLTQNDLTDHVSGISMSTKNASYTWNSTHNMYDIKKTSAYGGAFWSGLNLGLSFSSSSYSNAECTCVFDFVWVNSSDKKYANFVGLAKGFYNASSSHRFPLYYLNIMPNISLNVKYKIAWTLSGGVFKFYINGQEVTVTTPHDPTDTFDFTECNSCVSLATGNWNGNNGGGCFGNIRVYDRALTASEVAQL